MIHRAAATGFARSVAEYERGRPGYPPAALDALELRPGLVVLDLAAGTGKLTRPLLEAGAEVIAVEPIAEMRAALPCSASAYTWQEAYASSWSGSGQCTFPAGAGTRTASRGEQMANKGVSASS